MSVRARFVLVSWGCRAVWSLVEPAGRVWIAPDGDKAGERHAQTLLSLISPQRFVRWVKLDEGKQPTDLSNEQLKSSLTP